MYTSEEIIRSAADRDASSKASASGSGTILLVEDDYSIRRYFDVILCRAGFTVVTAADGLEAMKVLLKDRIDLVVTDAIMPHLSGYDLCRFIRRHPRLSQLPVVLLSGLEHSAPEVPASERADVYMAKPVKPLELTACLRSLLSTAIAA